MRKIVFALLLTFVFCASARAATTVNSDTELAAAIANPLSGDIVLGTNITMGTSFDIPINRSLKISAGGRESSERERPVSNFYRQCRRNVRKYPIQQGETGSGPRRRG